MIDKTQLITKGCQFLTLTYEHSAKSLPKAVAEVLIQLPGGENWFNRKQVVKDPRLLSLILAE
jgi:hypothetical protein